MSSVCFYFQVHQPRRLKRLRIFDLGKGEEYFNDASDSKTNNEKILRKVAEKSYLPANAVMAELLLRHPEFRFAFSFSGIFLEQLEEFSPETLESFQRLVATGRVEVLAETYYHSLAALYSPDEFAEQVALHREKVRRLFGVAPTVFRNTEFIYSDEIGARVAELGYKGMLAEGADRVLKWRSPGFLYHHPAYPSFALLLKQYRLSDDIAFRFGERGWSEWPVTAEKYAGWLSALNGSAEVVNLFMDYETFGEHQWADTGIFDFMRDLPGRILAHPDNDFVTPREAIDRYKARYPLSFPEATSWADIERDLSAWRDNPMQYDALKKVYDLRSAVLASREPRIIEAWRRLTTSDHFYYMGTKGWADGDVHKYFSPYESPYDAFIAYANALHDLQLRVGARAPREEVEVAV